MSQTPLRLIYLVVITIGTLAMFGLGSLCSFMFLGLHPDPSILTAIITLTSGLIGSLQSILSNPRTHPPGETVTTTTTEHKVAPTPGKPMDVNVVNTISDPANVTEIKEK